MGYDAPTNHLRPNTALLPRGNPSVVAETYWQGGLDPLEVHHASNLDCLRQATVDGSIQCKENSTSHAGGGNQVSGDQEDQCRSM